MHKKVVKVLSLVLIFSLMSALLVACGGDNEPVDTSNDNNNAAQTGQTIQQPEDVPPPNFGLDMDNTQMGGDIDFGLQSPGDPDFDNVPVGSYDDGLYTIEDGFAYALDPATLDKVGPPLDPVTHEPVGEGPVVEEPPVEEPLVEEPTIEPPPEEIKLPNTGMFLEDD